jgi:hypothetical protein
MSKLLLVLVVAVLLNGCSWFQSREISRRSQGMLALNIEVPADCYRVLQFSSGREGYKELLCQRQDGTISQREYSDTGLNQSRVEFKKQGKPFIQATP